MIVESFLIIPMASFDLSVMPRRPRSDGFMVYIQLWAKLVKYVYSFCLLSIAKFTAIICLDHFGCIAKIYDCTLYKIYCWVSAVFSVRIDKAFSVGSQIHLSNCCRNNYLSQTLFLSWNSRWSDWHSTGYPFNTPLRGFLGNTIYAIKRESIFFN